MGKGNRGNKEAKKPKQVKTVVKPPAPGSATVVAPGVSAAFKPHPEKK